VPNVNASIPALLPHGTLSSSVWEPCCNETMCEFPMHYCLRKEIRDALVRISNEFYIFLDIGAPVKDITFTGSLANFNYTQASDIDLHLIFDFQEIDENIDLVKSFLNAKKAIWNDNHDITIKGHEVELYSQDYSEPHHSTGVYSILHDEWIIEPIKKPVKINKHAIREKTKSIISQIDLALESPDRRKNLEKLKVKIRDMRKAGLERSGEFSIENLTFKMLRRLGYIDKVYSTSLSDFDKALSIDE
jgi:hypothetical protein